MYYPTSPYRKFIPEKLKGPAIILFILIQGFVFGITGTTASRLSAFFGIEPSVVSWFAQINTVGTLVMIPIYYRLKLYFKKIDLLYIALGGELFISVMCFTTQNAAFLLGSNFFLGMVKMMCTFDCISLLGTQYTFSRERPLFYGLVYSITQPSREISDIFISPLIEEYNWQIVYLVSAVAAIICIVFATVLFHGHRMQRKIPLYQIDWWSVLLFIITAFTFCYVLNFGKTEDWFESHRIQSASLLCLLTASVFIYRQFHTKRPFWNLRIFRVYKQVPLGASFMVLMYLFFSSNIIFNQFAGYNFKNDENHLIILTSITLLSYFLFFPTTGILLHKKVPKRVMLFIGFSLYAFSLFLFYRIVQTELQFRNLILPYFLQGASYGITLTTLSTFTATNVSKNFNSDRVLASMFSRYILGSVGFSSLYSNWLYRKTLANETYMSETFNPTNPNFTEEFQKLRNGFLGKNMDMNQANAVAYQVLHSKLELQAMLVSIQNIAYTVCVLAVVAGIIALCTKKFGMHEIASKNRYKIV